MKYELTVTCAIDFGLMMNADEFRVRFFAGIAPTGSDSYIIRNQIIEDLIKQAQSHVENWLDIKMSKQVLYEYSEYNRNEWYSNGHINTTYPIKSIIDLKGMINERTIVSDIKQYFVVRSNQNDVSRGFEFVTHTFSAIFMNMFLQTPFYYNAKYVPNFWHYKYLTGFDFVPYDLYDYIGKRALMDLYNIHGNIVFPVGVASQSKSADGFSQSISTTISATSGLYGANHEMLRKEFERVEPRLQSKYKGICVTRI